MNREQARQYIIARGAEHFEQDRSKRGYICPICGSGSGANGTGITTRDGVHYTCWAGCFTNADVIDIIGLERGLSDYTDKLNAAADVFGVTIDGGGYRGGFSPDDFPPLDEDEAENQNQPETEQHTHTHTDTHTQAHIHNTAYTTEHTQPPEAPAEPDYTRFFIQAYGNIDKTDYHRGLSPETLQRFIVGYVPDWKHPKAPNMEPSPRLIIPTSAHSYTARYAGAGDYINYRGKIENKSKVGKVRIFNLDAIYSAKKPVFIVEGEIDALSIIDVGGEAVGLGSIAYKNKLLAELEREKPAQPLIIALDNDERGKGAASELCAELEKLGILFYRLDVAAPHKDANEALNADREAFTERVKNAEAKARNAEAEKQEAEREQLRGEAAAYALPAFLRKIEASKLYAFIPTGFSALDNELDGGLYPGLYCVGAISSLGKTTFCLQIADNIARAGHDVIIISMEMARDELIAKSISRLTYTLNREKDGAQGNAKTTRGIMTGTRYADYNAEERALIQAAVAEYGEYARNIYIVEAIGDVGVKRIREIVERHKRISGKAPVVFIDYLQILAPVDIRATDKQNTDNAVFELRRICRDHSIPIIGISSFNRDNYTAPVNNAAFKESGAIEYSSDVLIGLQYYGMDYRKGEKDKAREARIRELMGTLIADGKAGKKQTIQAKILKQRNGSKGDVLLDYYPMFNYFENSREKPADALGDNGDGWETTTPRRQTKREKERAALYAAWQEAEDPATHTADLGDIADELDKTKKQVVNMLVEYGGYSIDGERVSIKQPEPDAPAPGRAPFPDDEDEDEPTL